MGCIGNRVQTPRRRVWLTHWIFSFLPRTKDIWRIRKSAPEMTIWVRDLCDQKSSSPLIEESELVGGEVGMGRKEGQMGPLSLESDLNGAGWVYVFGEWRGMEGTVPKRMATAIGMYSWYGRQVATPTTFPVN